MSTATPTFPTRALFTAYLRALPPRRIVGTPGNGCDCPLARYLRCEAGMPEAVVFVVTWKPDDSKLGLTGLPDWAVSLARSVDRTCAGRRVTAGRVLRLLESIPC